MSRRLVTLLLSAFIAVAGQAVCPRGMSACIALQQARHHCCGEYAAVRARDCCCKGSQRVSEASAAADRRAEHVQKVVAGIASHEVPPAAELPRALACSLAAPGLGPPDTPINRHTMLLL